MDHNRSCDLLMISMEELCHIESLLPMGKYQTKSDLIISTVIRSLYHFRAFSKIQHLRFEKRAGLRDIIMFWRSRSLWINVGSFNFLQTEAYIVQKTLHATIHVIYQLKRGIISEDHDIFFYKLGNEVEANFENRDRAILHEKTPNHQLRSRLVQIDTNLVENGYYELLRKKKNKAAKILKTKIVKEVIISEKRIKQKKAMVPRPPKLILFRGCERRVIVGSVETSTFAANQYPLVKRRFSAFLLKHGVRYLQTLRRIWSLFETSPLDNIQLDRLEDLRVRQYAQLKTRFKKEKS